MYKCLECEDISYKPLQPLIYKFANTYRSCNYDNQKFILLLRKRYEYIDDLKRFNESELPSKGFYSKLRLESIKDKDYEHAKNVWNSLK